MSELARMLVFGTAGVLMLVAGMLVVGNSTGLGLSLAIGAGLAVTYAFFGDTQ